MPDRLDPEAVFLEHLGTIEMVAARAARRYGLWVDDAEDFIAWVKMRLMENDYAVFNTFRGESDWRTFISMIVIRHASVYSRVRLARWRPSTAALRRGPPAPELEMLVLHHGYTLAQAGEKLRTVGATTLSDNELARLLSDLRGSVFPVQSPPDSVRAVVESLSRVDTDVNASNAGTENRGFQTGLSRVMSQLNPEDQIIVRMHFAERLSVADVSRILNLEQKPLYRRIEKLRGRLRGLMERDEAYGPDVRTILEQEEL